jgi:hypothetical protein
VTPVTNVDLHRRSPAARRPSPDDGRLFLNNRGRPLSPKALTVAHRHVDRLGDHQAGTCHLFRHTAATFADGSSTPTSASSNSCSAAPSSRPPSPLPDYSAGSFDYGGLGQRQRGTEHEAGIATIEMGARHYVPGLGRFLEGRPGGGGIGQRLRVRRGRSSHQLRSRGLCSTKNNARAHNHH